MKKYKKFLFGSLLLPLALTSCTTKDPSATTSGQVNSNNGSDTSVDPGQSSTSGENRKNELSFHSITLNDIYYSQGTSRAPSIGKYKVLVLPIEFSDERFEANYKENIKLAFEGSADKNASNYTGYSESLKSFYQKSSYGKLELDFVYADKYDVGQTAKKWYQGGYSNAISGGEKSKDFGTNLLKKAYDQYVGSNQLDKDLDSDSDGYIDATIMVYSTKDYSEDQSKTWDEDGYFWAYCYNATAFESHEWAVNPDVSKPIPDNYMFLSYDMIYDKTDTSNNGKPKMDYHTVVHEYGHILGLDDYYGQAEDSYGNTYNPMGGVVMQDFNICDHDAFSKTQFGWTNYTYVTTSGEYKIKNLESSGETIIIPTSKSNGTLWDEYIQIELYSPTGLNELDSKTAYSNNKGLSTFGIKVYHIDNRLFYFDGEDETKYGYVDLLKDGFKPEDNYYYVGASNSQKLGAEYVPFEFNLCHLIQAGGEDTYCGDYATNADLFQSNSTFDPLEFTNYFKDAKANNGATFNFKIEFTSVTSEEATIKVTFR